MDINAEANLLKIKAELGKIADKLGFVVKEDNSVHIHIDKVVYIFPASVQLDKVYLKALITQHREAIKKDPIGILGNDVVQHLAAGNYSTTASAMAVVSSTASVIALSSQDPKNPIFPPDK